MTLATAIGKTKAYWQANGKAPLALDERELQGCSSFGDVVGRLYLKLARRHGKARWGEKSPMNVQHITELARAFPDALFIHIIRDGRDCAQSFHRRWGFDPRRTVWRWKHLVAEGRRQGAALGERYLELRYEALTAEPEREMRRVCAFVRVPFEPAVLDSSMRHMDKSNLQARSGRIVANPDRWMAYFDLARRRSLERICGRMLSELGYRVDHPGDAELSSLQLRYLGARDAWCRSRAFFRQYGLRALPMFLRTAAAARKQWSASR
jgi:hypothetical protein